MDKGCSGILGYACMGLKNSRFLVDGAAGWGGDAKGRTPDEFGFAWAARQGVKDPVTVTAMALSGGSPGGSERVVFLSGDMPGIRFASTPQSDLENVSMPGK